MTYPQHLLKLISVLKNLPGIGSRTAERFAFHLLDMPSDKLKEMGFAISGIKENLITCPECFALIGKEGCPFCDLSKRNKDVMCITGSCKELFLIEETRHFTGLYHVLKGGAALLQKKNPEGLEKLKSRIETLGVKEVILAFDATIEGDGAALFLKKELAHLPLTLSRLAFGIPMGSSFEFLDGGTLAKALQGRNAFR